MAKKLKPVPVCYTIQKITATTDKHYGAIHGSYHGEETVCGKELNSNWYIISNDFSRNSTITCKKCLQKLRNHDDYAKKFMIPAGDK